MLLFVGLGNPEAEYSRNRHNIGFMAIDALAAHYNAAPFREKFKGSSSEINLSGVKVLLLKPTTYMNLSGESVQEAAHFYKLDPASVVVFQDEIDLAPRKIKVQSGGGTAGHNGIKSIVAHFGDKFRRVRLGVGHPNTKEQVTNHVLGNFSSEDETWLTPLLAAICEHAPLLAKGDDVLYQTRIAEKIKGEA